MFLELGYDFGFLHGYQAGGLDYVSFYPYGRLNGYLPLGKLGGWFGGLGGGVMVAVYTFKGERQPHAVSALDLGTGLYIGEGPHYLTISYTLRTDFKEANSKVSAGYCYRFFAKEGAGEKDMDIMGLRR
jgi:hypothetical protein